MKKDREKNINHSIIFEPPEGLFEKIMFRIREEQRLLILKKRLAFFSIGMMVSVVSFIPLFNLVQTELSKSGFLQFFSLLFSDFQVVAAYWQNFIMSLLEAIPAMSLALFLIAVFIFLQSLKFWIKNIKLIFQSKPLIN